MSGKAVKIPEELRDALEEFRKRHPWLGFSSASAVAQDAVREYLRRYDRDLSAAAGIPDPLDKGDDGPGKAHR